VSDITGYIFFGILILLGVVFLLVREIINKKKKKK